MSVIIMKGNGCDGTSRSLNASALTALQLQSLLIAARVSGAPHPLRNALFSLVARDVCIGTAFYVLGIIFSLVNPVIIYSFLEWVPTASESNWLIGAILCVCLGFANGLCFYCEAAFASRTARAGLRARLGTASLVFRALGERHEGGGAGAGSAHNLHGVDAASLTDLPAAVATLILQPFELGAIIAMLAYFVGAGAAGALLAVAACMAVVLVAGARALKIDAQRGAAADVRVAVLSEFVTGARAAKLLGWESRFAAAISAARTVESELYTKAAGATALVHVASSNGVDIISVFLLLVYVLGSPRFPLTPAVVFTYWVLLATLHGRVFHFPPAAASAREGLAALKRLSVFLESPPVADPRGVMLTSAGRGGLQLDAAALGWPGAGAGAGAGAANAKVSKCKKNKKSGGEGPPPPPPPPTTTTTISPPPHISPITCRIAPGSIWVILGPVGSGKTLVLSALLGEAPPLAGAVLIAPETDFGYAPQTPFTLPSSVRANIVLGRAWDPAWYARVVTACALDADFAAWPNGDASSVSSTVLSGGQRARVAIARAVYGRPAVLLLDDTLAALDVHVAATLRRELLLGPNSLCNGTTRIITTHSPQGWMDDVDGIIILAHNHNSGVADRKSSMFNIALTPAPPAAPFMSYVFEGGAGVAGAAARVAAMGKAALATVLGEAASGGMYDVGDVIPAVVDSNNIVIEEDDDGEDEGEERRRRGRNGNSNGDGDRGAAAAATAAIAAAAADAYAAIAESSTGISIGSTMTMKRTSATLPFFASFVSGVGGIAVGSFALFLLFMEAAWVEVGVVVLAKWADDGVGAFWPVLSYLGLYCATVVGELIAAYGRQLVYTYGTRRSADELHAAALARLAAAPVSVFAHAPGALISLFGRDLALVDQQTWYASEYYTLAILYSVLVACLQVAYTPWSLLAFTVPILTWYTTRPSRLVETPSSSPLSLNVTVGVGSAGDVILDGGDSDGDAGSPPPLPPPGLSHADLRALEANARVPLVTLVAVAVDAPAVARAFPGLGARLARAADSAAAAHSAFVSAAARADSASLLRANLLGVLYYVCQVAVIVPLAVRGNTGGVDGDRLSGGAAGLLVVNAAFASYMMQLLLTNAQLLGRLALLRGGLVRAATRLPVEAGTPPPPAHLEALQRKAEGAAALPVEASAQANAEASAAKTSAATAAAKSLPPSWPAKGALSFSNVSIRYAPDGPRALDGACLDIPAGSHVAVVGRTGAGKSSLIAALARLVELESGLVTIDGIDAASLPLSVLRSSFVCITQDPLFSQGTLRRNLDPFNEYTDEALLGALDRVGLGRGLRGGGGNAFSSPSSQALLVLSTPVAARGANLSCGQAQLLALSRALLRRPTLLVLDEATAALSRADEARVLATVRSSFTGVTVLAITHRLAGTLGADAVAVVDGGRVVEVGAPRDLLANPNSFFSVLVDAAPGGEGSRLRAKMRIPVTS